MRHYSEFGFADIENAKRYSKGSPANFLPGMSVMHELTMQLMEESMGSEGSALLLGAGGGLELDAFAKAKPTWKFTAVDPSPQMLEVAKEKLDYAKDRITWAISYIADAPMETYDSATCLLTLHLIPDDGTKLSVLKDIKSRLKEGGRFIIVDNCFDRKDKTFDTKMARFINQARTKDIPEDILEMVQKDVTEKTESISEHREVELLEEAGFKNIDLFFASLSWRGWVAEA
jgi:tRNA (cmo5U34)-methyltransferase